MYKPRAPKIPGTDFRGISYQGPPEWWTDEAKAQYRATQEKMAQLTPEQRRKFIRDLAR